MKKLKTGSFTTEEGHDILDNMSDGIITVTADGTIHYVNSAVTDILGFSADDLLGQPFADTLLTNRKNRVFNQTLKQCLKKNCSVTKEAVTVHTENGVKFLRIKTTLFHQPDDDGDNRFQGMMLLIEDVTDAHSLKQHERDCAMLFAGIVICITVYLSVWSLLQFTLHIPLSTSSYTLMIEGMTLILFLELVFFTSFSLGEIGIIPHRGRILANVKQTFAIAVFAWLVLLVVKLFLYLLGAPIKNGFVGGSLQGAFTYLLTALLQEFLARGVIQTSVKNLMRVRHQVPISILLTSLLFTLMHLPFGFIFMAGACFLSIALGILFEQQKSIWGCFFLHWSVGYLAMCLFF